MWRLAKQVGANEQMLRFAVLNGLRPHIKNHVTMAQPSDWRALVEAAKVGEMCSPTSSPCDDTVTVQLALMKYQLKQLTTEIKPPTSAPVSALTYGSPRFLSPRRDCFNDDRRFEPTD